ncbi:hypothetical protein C8J57DRAFT_1255645 [Mycena rebaudengoi]|nr:hypothetical protein C8J57DRAFT_1255645 [Mycena rebaudengoi]
MHSLLVGFEGKSADGSHKDCVSRLPQEVLSNILRLAVGCFDGNAFSYAISLETLRSMTRAMWSSIYVDPWTPLGRVIRWIKRAKGCGLHFYLVIGRGWPHSAIVQRSAYSPTAFVDAVFDIIGPCFGRCRHFYADSKDAEATARLVRHLISVDASDLLDMHLRLFPDYFPSNRLGLDGDTSATGPAPRYMFNGMAPLLARLTLQCCLFSSASGYEFCKNITELRLEDLWTSDLRLSELLELFRSTPRLVRLRLRFVDCVGLAPANCAAPVLACLVHLDFSPMSTGSCRLLSHLVLPALNTMDLLVEQSQLMLPLLSLCGRTLERVTAATLALPYISGADFGALLCSMRALRYMDCRKTAWGADGILGDIGTGMYGRCPTLELIIVDFLNGTDRDAVEFSLSVLTSGVFAPSLTIIMDGNRFGDGKIRRYTMQSSALKGEVLDSFRVPF